MASNGLKHREPFSNVSFAQVRIAFKHLQRLVSADLAHCHRIKPEFEQAADSLVAQVVI